jgi:hypothetical protein
MITAVYTAANPATVTSLFSQSFTALASVIIQNYDAVTDFNTG